MPELPEVESVRRQLAARLRGRRILALSYTPQERFAALDLAAGRVIERLDRRGKYLIAGLGARAGAERPPEGGDQGARAGAERPPEGGDQGARAGAERPPEGARLELVMHLGMTGSFRFRDGCGWRPDAYVRASFELDDGAVLDFRDVRRFGRLCVVQAGAYGDMATLAGLGPEPLGEEFDPVRFHAALRGSRMAVKPFLLTQRPVAGVGNIYADEALWRAGINPRARRIGPQRARALWGAIREVLTEAIEREGTTFRDYRMVNGESGRNAGYLAAYGREGRPCLRCGTTLVKTVLAGRGTTYCPRCQRR